MKKIKILYILPSLNRCNGVTSYALNYFRNIDKEKFQIDFVDCSSKKLLYEESDLKKFSKVYTVPRMNIKNIRETIKSISNIFKENDYDIVHSHVVNMGVFFLYFAKKYGIKVRIIHSHATKYGETILKSIRNFILSKFLFKYATTYFACSKAAGKKIFGNRKFEVIYNAIDIEKYEFSIKNRIKIRNELNIKESEILIGNFGRFSIQKNQKYLIDLLEYLNTEKQAFKLLFIGDGPLMKELKDYSNTEKDNNCIFLSSVPNINEYYSAIDVFALSSFFEGLPVVGIEAQANGLPCIFSNQITDEVKINNNVYFCNLKKYEEWINILKNKEAILRTDKSCIEKSKYNIKFQVRNLERRYLELIQDL